MVMKMCAKIENTNVRQKGRKNNLFLRDFYKKSNTNGIVQNASTKGWLPTEI